MPRFVQVISIGPSICGIVQTALLSLALALAFGISAGDLTLRRYKH